MKLPDNTDELRAVVRAEVIAVMQRLLANEPGAASSDVGETRRLVLLFMGPETPSPDFLSRIAELAQQGCAFAAAFSRTFSEHNDVGSVLRSLPAGTTRCQSDSETALAQTADAAHGLVAERLSLNTAAKVAGAICDSLPSHLLLMMAMQAKPILIAQDLGTLAGDVRSRHPAVAPGLLRLVEDRYHKVQQLGVQFVPVASLADAVAAAYYQPSNDTPSRLAVQRPSPKRRFITAEDVWKAVSVKKTELVCPADAVITDQARDYAQTHGIVLRQE